MLQSGFHALAGVLFLHELPGCDPLHECRQRVCANCALPRLSSLCGTTCYRCGLCVYYCSNFQSLGLLAQHIGDLFGHRVPRQAPRRWYHVFNSCVDVRYVECDQADVGHAVQ
jgi:hypothetical protein